MALKPVFFIIGLLLTALGTAMLIPAAVVIHVDSYDWGGFVYGAVITIFFGVLMALANQHPLSKFQLGVREAFLMTTLSWTFIIIFASLPLILSSQSHSITDSLFEATSALTTTGATTINHLDKANPGILLWRAILQWLGGVGIIVMALTILPLLRIGGMQLFRTEFSDRSDRTMPRVSHIAKSIIAIQATFTIFFTTALIFAGLKPLDAICHAMGALTTGGLSTSDNSIGGFANPIAEMIIIACMFIGSCTVILFIRIWNGDWRSFFMDPQIRGFTYVIFFATAALIACRLYHDPHSNLVDLSRETLFTVLSVTSSTGYTVTDYSSWGNFALLFIFVLTFVGGCTGSTTGGVKIFRLQVLWTIVKTQMAQLRRPHGVFLPHYNKQVLSENVIYSVFTFFSLFGLTFVVITILLSLCKLDLITCISASAAAITNTGVGIGPLMNPSSNCSTLSDPAKWIMMMGMLLGRLEMMTILTLLSSKFWHR